ncbi:MAG: tetratricopeptide repeat protein [Gammaproteobacteria bacterium]|nr:tetratricopeptide repeat protein [Gammaproteobacteria bacterium]
MLAATMLMVVSFSVFASADPLKNVKELLRSGQYDKALPRLEAFLQSNPKHAEARFLKGLALAERGESERAQDVFLALTDDYPELPEPHNNLAVLYAAKGEFTLARASLLQAISNRPNYATAHENLGDIYARMAGIAYGKALELDDANQTARVKLAMVQELFSERGPAAASIP